MSILACENCDGAKCLYCNGSGLLVVNDDFKSEISANRFQVIYADPPWRYGGGGAYKWHASTHYYPSLTFDQLKVFGQKLKPLFDSENCILFLWVVNPELKRCIEVGESWGFKYITTGFLVQAEGWRR